MLALSCAGFAAAPASADPQTGTEGYVGLSLGYAGGGDDRVGLSPSGLVVGTLDNSGPLAGGLVGLRRQSGGLAYGIELEGLIADVSDSVASTGVAAQTTMTGTVGLRARLGLVRGATTFYVAAGPSQGWFDYSVSGAGIAIDRSFSRIGYSLGLGWERPLSDRLSLRGEYLYSNFGSETLSDPVSGATTTATPTYHRVGLALIGRF